MLWSNKRSISWTPLSPIIKPVMPTACRDTLSAGYVKIQQNYSVGLQEKQERCATGIRLKHILRYMSRRLYSQSTPSSLRMHQQATKHP